MCGVGACFFACFLSFNKINFFNQFNKIKPIMKRKLYEKPSAEVVKLQQKEALLQNSVNATMDGTFEEVEM